MAPKKRRKVPIPTPAEIVAIRGKRSQEEAADLVGVSQGTWSDWENGNRTPSQQSAILLNLLRHNKLPK